MEQFNDEQNNNEKSKTTIYEKIDGIKSFISTFLGVIVALIGIAVVFVVSSLEGTKEIKASNSDSAKMMTIFRNENIGKLYPEEKVDIIRYEDKDYYFVVEKYDESGTIIKWYFAYEGGLGYVFSDYKFYILTGITIMVSIIVSQINYTTAVNSAMNTTKFLKTLKVYQDSKIKVVKHTQYIPSFCSYKNEQLYDEAKREIVESANITYDFFNSEKYDYNKLENWQKKIIDQIKTIKIERISPSDLLQERGTKSSKKSLLPIAPNKHKRNYLIRSIIQKTFSSALSGMVVALGVILGNWFLGITYGFTVLMSFIMANITGADYANSSLRQRYIAKSDLLNEFYNMVDYFKEKEKEIAPKQVEKRKPTFEGYPLLLVNQNK